MDDALFTREAFKKYQTDLDEIRDYMYSHVVLKGKENHMNELNQVRMNITGYGQGCEAKLAREPRNSQIESALARLQNKIGEFSMFLGSCQAGGPAKLYDSPQGCSPTRPNRPLFDLLDSIPDELNKASAELGEIISTLRARLI